MGHDIADSLESVASAISSGFPSDNTADKRMFCETFLQHAGSAEFAADMLGITTIYKSLVDTMQNETWDAEEMFEEAWDCYLKVKKTQGTHIHHMQPATSRY